MIAANRLCRRAATSLIFTLASAVSGQPSLLFAAPLVDFTSPGLVHEFGGKESHIYPWGTGADQRRATRCGMAYIEVIGNGQRLTTVSAVFGFTSKETGAPNVGGPENTQWFLRVEPISPAQSGTWRVDTFWNTGNGAYTPSPVPNSLDRSWETGAIVDAPIVGTFLGVNLRKVTVDASASNYVLEDGQRYRLVLIPWTREPIPAGCTSANPACITFLVGLPSLSFARDGGIGVSAMESFYFSLLEYRSYGGNGGKNSLIGLEGPNWAYDVQVACTDTDGSASAMVAGTVTNSGGAFSDYCVMRFELIEQSCGPNGERVQQVIGCPQGCLAGRCL